MPRTATTLGALGLLFLFLTFFVTQLGPYFAVIAVGLLGASVAYQIGSRRRSRYDLYALRELHESGGPASDEDLPEVADDAGVLCPCCGTVYAAWMLVCPQCKR